MAEEQAKPTEGRSRGPAVHSGGEQEIGAPTPPYEGRKTGGVDDEQQVGDASPASPREVSKEEREGVPPEDTTAASPLGAGTSSGARGEEQMLGASEEELREARMSEGVGGSDQPIDPQSPDVRVGDQGG